MRPVQIVKRTGTVAVLSVILWRFVIYLDGIVSGNEYDRTVHFLMAFLMASLSYLMIRIALGTDKISWRQIGSQGLRTDAISFFTGVAIWTVPALLGLLLLRVTGRAEITLATGTGNFMLSAGMLFATVFLMEAFPEEIIVRGYIYSHLNLKLSRWQAVIVQAVIFSVFAFLIGAMYSMEQIMFIPGFGLMMGYLRARSGNVWVPIGFHTALMTASQILNPIHGIFGITDLFLIRFLAFNLLPYILGSAALEYIYPDHSRGDRNPGYRMV